MGRANPFVPCKYAKAENNPSLLACPPGPTAVADDTGSNAPDNRVTVYACFNWTPPMAGFLFDPEAVDDASGRDRSHPPSAIVRKPR